MPFLEERGFDFRSLLGELGSSPAFRKKLLTKALMVV